jgi:phosphatidylglycerol---prolipoprotein diacylglyceryl transferase
MYPTLTDFFRDVFGVNIPLPIQTYGFFVALAFLTGIFFLSLELKRKEKEGLLSAITKKEKIGEPAKISAILLAALGGFVIGFKLLEAVFHYSAFVDNPQDFILSARGNILGGIIGAGLAGYMNWRDKEKQKLDKPKWVERTIFPHDLAGNMLIIAAIFGLLGAKLFHNLENLDDFMKDPIEALISFSGLTFLGGLIVGVTAVLIYARKNNIPSLHLVDGAAPALALAYGVGRLGCQVSGDGCWGVPNPNPKPDWMSFLPDWMWSFDYPHNVINAGSKMVEDCATNHCHVLDVPVFPTPFYETSMMLVVFFVLWGIRKKVKIPGIMFSLFITLAGFERFFIEKIRINNEYNIFGYGITQAEIISSIMIVVGIAAVILFYKKGHQINEWLNAKMKIPEPVEQKSN